MIIKIDDASTEDASAHFDSAYEFIKYGVENYEPVLVHCGAGISRSSTFVCAFLMKEWKKSYEECIEYLQSK